MVLEMAVSDVELEVQLKEAGNKLLYPPSSSHELNVEHLLINVEQAPSRSMQDALLPPMKALISSALLSHSDADVKVSVASCVSEITRITAPDAPYNDEQMKVYFEFVVEALESLSHASSFCYKKSISILETIAKVRSNHPHSVFLAMEAIMTMVIDQSEEISFDLLTPLLASTRNQSQSVSPMAWKLGVKVMSNCAAKLRSSLKKAVESTGVDISEYAPIVATICQDETFILKDEPANGSGGLSITERPSADAACPREVLELTGAIPISTVKNGTALTRNDCTSIIDDCTKVQNCSLAPHSKSTAALAIAYPQVRTEIEPEMVPRKRGRKPNSLMNPEEGYYPSWHSAGSKTGKMPLDRKPYDREIGDSPSETLTRKVDPSSGHMNVMECVGSPPKSGGEDLVHYPLSLKQTLPVGSDTRRRPPKKKVSIMDQDTERSPSSSPKVEILGGQVEKKNSESDDGSFRKQSKERYTSEAKTKNGLATSNFEDLSQTSGYVVSKTGVPSRLQRKRHRSNVVVVGSSTEGSSLAEIGVKRSSINSTIDEHVTEASGGKKSQISNRDGGCLEETPKPAHKRQRTPRKEVVSEIPDLGEELIGCRINVWWPLDRRFYEGILYADGDVEILNLRKQRFELIDDDISAKEHKDTHLTDPDASSNVLKNVKRKAKAEPTRSQKTDSSSKRNRATITSETNTRRSGRRPADGAVNKKTTAIDRVMDDSLGNEHKSTAGKVKAEIPSDSEETESMTSIPSIQKTTEGGDEFAGINSKASSDSTTPSKD
ncbi:hypothetical protein Tsubulata_038176 [Turnera subulata]|uniref:Tudor domain-containing protein n=1 Tax=Turnera subulata TaxID=218843 RepID=A0A9Q0JDR2_9ROSI|nr:hypothetical protein Tsubulata_038176 [Turnera subulata]